MHILIATNSATYQEAIETFLTSVKMSVPKGTAPSAIAPATTSSPAAAPSGENGAGSTSTTFDDGWASSLEADWVRVTRPGFMVFLHYGITHDDTTRQDTIGALWPRLVVPRYALSNAVLHAYRTIDFPFQFRQATATDRAGNRTFVSLYVLSANGVAYAIEVHAASREAYDKQFASLAAHEAIRGANRFAIGNDVAGTWSNVSGASVDMYYVGTGGYAGMNSAVVADRFELGTNGRYVSEHKGASGMVGSQKVFQTKYKGTYSTGPWELTFKRSDGTTTVYAASYSAVRGGRVLHLQDKKYAGMQYSLHREK